MFGAMKTVMIFGTFDGVHEGHRALFRQAKEHGDFLIVVVARDTTVMSVKKHSPKYSEDIRYSMLFAEKNIDEVVLGDEKDKYAIIKNYNPDVIGLGYDQEKFVQKLYKKFPGEIVRLSAFQPERYKSSKMVKNENIYPRAKSILREHLLSKRREISLVKRVADSQVITHKILSLPEIKKAFVVALYYPMGAEVDTRKLLRELIKMNKVVLVPLVQKDGQTIFSQVTEKTEFSKGEHGYLVPLHASLYEGVIDVCVVPCVGFDIWGNRLGRGKGCYDRISEQYPEALFVGVAFEEQEVLCLPVESHDRPMDVFCTAENGLPVIRRYDTLVKENIQK